MRPTSIIVLLCLIGLAAQSVLAQSTAGNSGTVHDLLLRPNGWIFEWKPAGTGTKYGDPVLDTGTAELVFEARGDHIILRINNITQSVTCEHEAKLSGGAVTFDMCVSAGARMLFDPADREYPFKGVNYGGNGMLYDERMKPK